MGPTKKPSGSAMATLKMVNKELVLNLQRIKKKAAATASQNCSLKAELYDMIMEKNALMNKNTKLVELLRSLQQEHALIGKRIDDALGTKDSDRSRSSSSSLPTKQSAAICPMVSGHVIHKPKVELRRLNFNDYPNMEYATGNDEVCLSPVIEQQYEAESSETGRNSNNCGRSSSLLTINVISSKNDPQTSEFVLNPSFFVNVCPRKEKFGSRVSSTNQEFSLSNVKQESNGESQDSSYANILNLKYPIVLSERLPAEYNESLTANPSGNTNKEEKSKGEKTETKKRRKSYLRSLESDGGSPQDNTTDSSSKRRSVRSRKAISYKE